VAVRLPRNDGTKAITYVFTLTATGVTFAKTKPIKVIVVRGGGGVPLAAQTLASATSVAGDGLTSYCASSTSGGVSCWGDNSAGQLGDGTAVPHRVAAPVVSPDGMGTLGGVASVVGVDSDADHTFCAVLFSGGVDCWGRGQWGQLGNGSTRDSPIPVPVVDVGGSGLLTHVRSLIGGGEGFCAVLISGGVDCWGQGIFGQLGNGTSASSSVAVTVVDTGGQPISSVEQVVADSALGGFCALQANGGVECWGHNISQQLGIGIFPGPSSCGGDPCATTARRVVGVGGDGVLTGVTGLAGDGASMCASLLTGHVVCWGGNAFGQLGNGSTTSSTVPETVLGPGGTAPLAGVVSVANDSDVAFCALLADSGVACWGDATKGEIGNGTTAGLQTCGARTCSLFAVDVVGPSGSGRLSGVTALVSARSFFAGGSFCALLGGVGGGAVDCWGTGYRGQTGRGVFADSGVPAPVVAADGSGPLTGITSFGVGQASYCALASTGGVSCWGADRAGQLGDGVAADRATASPVLAS